MSSLRPWHRAALGAVIVGLAVSLLAWIAHTDPVISYLARYRGADWIVFPAAVDSRTHWYAPLDATFRREFDLPHQPATADLSVRALRRAEVKINGASIQLPQNRNWKNTARVRVAEQLHKGSNVLEVRVFNHNGPPALWLLLSADELSVRSDQDWEVSFAGSSWRHAALTTAAKTPGRGNTVAGGESTFEATQKLWPLWILLIGIAYVAMICWRAVSKQFTPASLQRVILFLVIALWLLLFWNNTRLLPFHVGFDGGEHLKYIEYIQKHWSLPLPTDGWEMYQPPLYYFVAAVVLSICKLSINDPASVIVLRALGAFFGVAQCALVFFTLRLLVPFRTALVGLLLAAFLPMHLYVAHYVTNEIVTAVLATLTIYLCLRLLKNEAPRPMQFVAVGLALGATMLAKATGILLLPIVIAAVLAKLLHMRVPLAASSRDVALLFATCLAVGGWHYARIWMRFGIPLLGNWDVISGFTWWQDPGYHTALDYFRFGRSLIRPIFSGYAGFADGIYSTLWGDGLSGGASSINIAWNLRPMAAGYLWALVPTALILVGAGVALFKFVRQPSSEVFLLLAFSGIVALGLIMMTLKLPSYEQAKAFFGLSALTPLCFFGALGWQTVTHSNTNLRVIVTGLVLLWAMNSLATFWIIPSVPQHLLAVKILGLQGKIEKADAEAAKAVEIDSTSAAAHGYRALSLSQLGNDAEAIKEGERAVQLAPSDSAAHLNLAVPAAHLDIERAIAEARRAIELGPENLSAYQLLMQCLLKSARYSEATELGLQWLGTSPYDADAHSGLAAAMAQTGDLTTAARHLGYVLMLRPNAEEALAQLHQIVVSFAKAPDGLQRLRHIAANAPDSPRMLDELAWLLATHPDRQWRDGAEAVRLAERACVLTDRRIAALLATLAAAYAETEDFPRGVLVGEEAQKMAESIGDDDSVKLTEKVLARLRENLPFRQPPE